MAETDTDTMNKLNVTNSPDYNALENIPAWMNKIMLGQKNYQESSSEGHQKSVFIQALHHHVQHSPDGLAVAEEDVQYTWAQWHKEVHRLSALLLNAGVGKGDHVAVMLENRWQVLALFLALRRLGAVMVPMNLTWAPQDMVYVCQHANPKLFVTQSRFIPSLQQLPNFSLPVGLIDVSEQDMASMGWTNSGALFSFNTTDTTAHNQEADQSSQSVHVDGEALALLLYTSGTTGKPKGVMLSEQNLWANIQGIVGTGMFQSEDRLLVALPLFHCYGLTLSLSAMVLGLPIVLEPTFMPKRLLQSLVRYQVSVLPLVPTLFQVLGGALAKGQVTLPDLRLCVSGGASLPPVVLSQFKEQFNITILEGYGMTEASPVVAVNRLAQGPIVGSVGLPLHNVDVRLEGDLGEVWVRGDNVMMGYYQASDITKETLTDEGWLKTGDLGRLDEAGNLYLTGRAKELIIKAGENVSPVAIEHALLNHQQVKEVCVVGKPDEKLGEKIVAIIVPEELDEKNELNESSVKVFARGVLSSFQVPDDILFWAELPKNGAGKIVRRLVQQQMINGTSE